MEITEDDLPELEEDINALLKSLPDMVPTLVEDVTPAVVKWIDTKGRGQFKRQRKALRGFEKRLARTWREPFDLLDLIAQLSVQVGQEVGGEALQAEAPDQQMASLIIRLHGRGVRIAREVLALLRSGYADGALARWRTLHEVTVVASFVRDHGKPCVERYVAHQAVANYKGALSYQNCASALGFAEYSAGELAQLKEDCDAAVANYGKVFRKDYGWAAPFLNGAPPNFAEIEKAVAHGHYRAMHKWASQEVHAGVKALFSDLSAPTEDVVLIGPSNTGFADPGQYTCISLAVLTAELLQINPTLDGLVLCSAINSYVDRAKECFAEVQQEVESRT